MLLLRGNRHDASGDAEVWSARAAVQAQSTDVLAALTDPELIAAWAPIGFELEGPEGRVLRTGSRERVSGSLAGLRASFDVEVTRAGPGVLELVAAGPLAMDVAYRFPEQGGRVVVDASVRLGRRGGLAAQILRGAVVALLEAGALDRALQRLASSLCERSDTELVAA
jgi:hypothetical protein